MRTIYVCIGSLNVLTRTVSYFLLSGFFCLFGVCVTVNWDEEWFYICFFCFGFRWCGVVVRCCFFIVVSMVSFPLNMSGYMAAVWVRRIFNMFTANVKSKG